MHFKLEHIYESCLLCLLCYMNIVPGVVACICNPATLEAEFRNGVDSIPVGGNCPSIGGWMVWPPVIQH